MMQHPYTSNTSSSQFHGGSQRQMSRSEYMNVKNIPIPNAAKKAVPEREAAVHRVRVSSNPADQQQRNTASHITHSTFGSQISVKTHPHFGDELVEKERGERFQLQEQLVTYATEIERLQQQVQEYSALTQSQDEKIRGLVELEKRYKAQQVEINQLRSKLSDERRLFEESRSSVEYFQQLNQSLTTELQQYQAASSNKVELENKVVLLAQEIERLKKMLEERSIEIEGFRGMERSYLKQMEDCKARYESQSKTVFHSQFAEVNAQHQQEIVAMEEQVRTYKQRVGDLKVQIESYINEINRTNQRYSDCSKERDNFSAELQQVSRDYELLKMQFIEKERDVEALTDRLRIVENKHQCEMNEMRSNFEFTKRSVCDGQMRELTVKFNHDRNALESQIRQLGSRIIDLENKIVLLSQENERMHYRFNEKNEELETLKSRILSLEIERQKLQAESLDWRQSYESLESSYQSKLQDLQFHVETQTQQAVETQLAIARNEWYKEKQLLGNELKGAHEKFTVSLSRLLLLDIEVERLNGKLVEYSSHIKQLESHLADVEQRYRYQYDQVIEEWQLKLKESMSINHQKETSIIQLQEKVAMLAHEIERLNFQLLDKSKEIELLGRQHDHDTRRLNSELDSLRSHLTTTESAYKRKCDDLQAELQRLARESALIKDQHINSLSRLLLADLEIERLVQMVQELYDANCTLDGSYVQLELQYRAQMDQLRADLVKQHQQELQQSEQTHRYQTEQLNKQHQRETNQQLQSLADEMSQQTQMLQSQYDDQLRSIGIQLQQTNISLQQSTLECEEWRKRYQHHQQLKQQELATLTEKQQGALTRLLLADFELERLLQTIQDLSLSLKTMNVQWEERYEFTVNEFESRNRQLIDDLEFSQQESLKKQASLTAERDRLSSLLGQRDEEIRRLGSRQDEQVRHYTREVEELYSQIESYTSEISMLQQRTMDIGDLETKFHAERTSWETLRQQMLTSLQDWENRYGILSLENKRLVKQSEEKYKEIELWKAKYNESALQSEFEELQRKYNVLKDDLFDMEQARVRSNSQLLSLETQLRHAQQTLESKDKEIENIYELVNRKRRESEISNKDVDTIKKQNLSLQHTVKNLETEVYQAQELGQQARREKEQLQTQVGYLERQLEQTRESMLQKGKELTDRIRELDLIKDKYQQQGVTVVSQRVSMTRQSIKTISTEQENYHDVQQRLKSSSSSVPPQNSRTPRQAMSVLNLNLEPVM